MIFFKIFIVMFYKKMQNCLPSASSNFNDIEKLRMFVW